CKLNVKQITEYTMQTLRRIKHAYEKQTPFVKVGIPFAVFMIGGSFGLQQFTSLRYEFTKVTRITPEKAAEYGLKKKEAKDVNIDMIYEEDIKKLDTENWENIRGPRPWENDGTSTEIMREKARRYREKQKKAQEQEQMSR
ncbi:cytochrome c oxidase assembly protein COX16 -like protein, partial [Tropilaelaps mercedesae]